MGPVRAILVALLLACTPLARADVPGNTSGDRAPSREDRASADSDDPAQQGREPPADGDDPPPDGDSPPADGDKPPADGGDPPSGEDDPPAGDGDGRARGGTAPAGSAADPEDEPAVGPSPSPPIDDEPAIGPSAAPPPPDGGGDGGGGGRGKNGTSGGGGKNATSGDAVGSAMWPKCAFETGNDTHTLLGIMNGRFIDRFGEATFTNLLQRVDSPTLRILKDFNVSTDGYTLIVPRNRATNFSDPNLGVEPLFSLYGIDPVFITPENASTIVRNHLIPETLTYFGLEQLTEAGMPARYKSLGDAVWEFTFFTTEGAVDGTVVLVDTYNVTQERADDILFMQWDISNAKQGDCPNTVFTVGGLLATEEMVAPPGPAMAPAPAPYVAPPPLPPRQIVGTDINSSSFGNAPAPAPVAPAGLVDEDRLEALAANQPNGCPGRLRDATALLPLASLAALLHILG